MHNGGQSFQVLSEYEENLVRKAEEWLMNKSRYEYDLVRERFRQMQALGNVVFDYPSIKDNKHVRDILIDENTLVDSLLAFSTTSHLLRTPTKVVAFRSFLVAKFHAFTLLSMLTAGNDELYKSAQEISFSVVFTLMAENVYFSCLDDSGFSGNTKSKLADDLIALWDSGTDPRSIRHLKALSSLWAARDSSPPSFGTMDGNTELLRISIDIEDTEWEDFLKEESSNNETRWALEEFLFGLSYEELLQVRSRLRKYSITSISHAEVRSFLDTKPVYSPVNDHDPRKIYDFFMERRDACTLRKRVSAPGPLHTLEENYLKYRIIFKAGK